MGAVGLWAWLQGSIAFYQNEIKLGHMKDGVGTETPHKVRTYKRLPPRKNVLENDIRKKKSVFIGRYFSFNPEE